MKAFVLTLSMLYVFGKTYSQNTTPDELNFVARGYQVMRESGLDMKKGYYLSDTSQYSIAGDKYVFAFINMRRQKDRSLAGTILIAKNKRNKIAYVGLPAATGNGYVDLGTIFRDDFNTSFWDLDTKMAFMQSITEHAVVLNGLKKTAVKSR